MFDFLRFLNFDIILLFLVYCCVLVLVLILLPFSIFTSCNHNCDYDYG